MAVYTSVDFKIYDPILMASIIVGEDDSRITVKTTSFDAWGKIDFCLDVETAKALVEALIEQIRFIEKRGH